MRDNLTFTPNVFVVYPEHQKLVSGEISFAEYSRRKLRRFIVALALIPILAIGILFTFSRFDPSETCTPILLIAVFVILVSSESVSALNSVQIYHRLENGEFLDGHIVASEFYAQSTGKNMDFRLSVVYNFQTSQGIPHTGTAEVSRRDLLWQAQAEYPGMSDLFLSDEDKKRLQEFSPPPNTPVKIRYVNDNLFSVM